MIRLGLIHRIPRMLCVVALLVVLGIVAGCGASVPDDPTPGSEVRRQEDTMMPEGEDALGPGMEEDVPEGEDTRGPSMEDEMPEGDEDWEMSP